MATNVKSIGPSKRANPILAAILAWIVPGLGHIYLGRKVRGIVIGLAIAATFWTGIALGGVLTVDKQNERWWYLAEMITGAHGLIGQYRSQKVYDAIAREPGIATAPKTGGDPSLYLQIQADAKLAPKNLALVAPMDTVARAYGGVAGLLNLMCIFDAAILALMGVYGESPRPEKFQEPEASET
jgi:hypothetical protein